MNDEKRFWVSFQVRERSVARHISEEANLRGLGGAERVQFCAGCARVAAELLAVERPKLRALETELELRAIEAARAFAKAGAQ